MFRCLRPARFMYGLAALAATGDFALAQHGGDFWVGRDGSSRVTISPRGAHPSDGYFYLPPVDGLLRGWADTEPGFDHVASADPANNAFPLAAGADIRLRVFSFDPAFRAIDNAFNILELPAQETTLGNHTLHEHLTWHINSDHPQFDPWQCVWEATFVLRDVGSTAYQISAPQTVLFTNVPTRQANGDFQPDGHVDLIDHRALPECLAGPGLKPDPADPAVTTCEVKCLNAFDFDRDGDVDLMDVRAFQNAFTG